MNSDEFCGSRKHLLDLVESDFRPTINALVSQSGLQLADKPDLRPYGRQTTEARSEFELEEYLASHCPHDPLIAEDWWIPHKTKDNKRPTWDLLAKLQDQDGASGLLLVEAKAHVKELKPQEGMSKPKDTDNSKENAEQIKRRIKETQKVLNRLNRTRIRLPCDNHFQLVNRFAYSCHLASLGWNVILLYLGFSGDTYFEDCIRNERHWQRVMGGYLNGIVSDSFPESLFAFNGNGSLQMLIEAREVSSASTAAKS